MIRAHSAPIHRLAGTVTFWWHDQMLLATTLSMMMIIILIIFIIIINNLLPRGKVRRRHAAIKAAKILFLVGLARTKQNLVNGGHVAQY